MPSFSWAKLWIDTLDDHKMGQLPDHLWRRFFELVLLAKERDDSGNLPPVPAMAWRLRTSPEDLLEDLEQLAEARETENGHGLVTFRDGEWCITDFLHSQRPTPYWINAEWDELRRVILERDHYACRYCGQEAMQADHVIPRSQGGTDIPDNLVAACEYCNKSKGGRTPEQAGMEMLDGRLPLVPRL